MTTSIGISRSIALGMAASVAMHAGLVVLLARYGTEHFSGGDPRTESDQIQALLVPLEPRDEQDIRRVKLGVEKSSAVTETWLGFVDPTEHSGPSASVEQAAMTLAAGVSEDEIEPEPASPRAATTTGEDTLSEPKQDQPQPNSESTPTDRRAHQPEGAPRKSEPGEARAPVGGAERPPTPSVVPGVLPSGQTVPPPARGEPSVEPLAQTLQDPATPEALSNQAGATVRPDAVNKSPAPSPVLPAIPTPAASNPSGSPAANKLLAALPDQSATVPKLAKPKRVSGDAGELSDRESVAAAVKQAIDVKPGRPAAAEGLEIRTARPRWSVTTQLTASPRNPVIWVTFGRNGKVIDADFLNGQNTGWTSVDEPLKDAVYRWTAKGVALSDLPADDPKAGLRLIFRVTLNGGE